MVLACAVVAGIVVWCWRQNKAVAPEDWEGGHRRRPGAFCLKSTWVKLLTLWYNIILCWVCKVWLGLAMAAGALSGLDDTGWWCGGSWNMQRPPTGSLLKAFTLAYVHSQIWLYMWNCIFFVDFCVRLSESTFMNPCSGQPFSLHVSSRLNQRILFELWQTRRLETRDHHNHRLAERLQKGFHQPSFLTIKCLSLCRWRPKMQTLQQSRTRKWWSKRCSSVRGGSKDSTVTNLGVCSLELK